MPEFQAYTPDVYLCVMGSTTLICLYIEVRLNDWMTILVFGVLFFFLTYQQQYVTVIINSARTGTRYPIYRVNICVHLIRALLQSPFLVYCLIFCDLSSFLAFGSASTFIRSTNYHTYVGTPYLELVWDIFCSGKRVTCTKLLGGAACALHFCRAAWPIPHTTGKRTRSCCFSST